MSKQILPDYIVRQDAVQAKVEEAKAMIFPPYPTSP